LPELGGVERAEAEAVYDAGRARCVEVVLELAWSVERLTAQAVLLEERVRRLEERSRESSRTGSKPPSSDPPKTRQQRRAEARAKAKELLRGDAERRSAGGQPGHEGAGRPLEGEDHVEEFVDHYPDRCQGCGHEFGADEKVPSRRPGRRQVAELPPISVVVTEHRAHRLRCPGCKRRTVAVFPADVAASAFGPRLRAAVVTLTARNRISRRDMSELARELFGIRLSVGTVDAICQRASTALLEPHEALVASVLQAAAVNLDETGWATAGEERTIWTATTPDAAVFRIAEDRHRDRLNELIGEDFAGICCSDRWWAYDHLDPLCRQVCWSHLQRDFRRHAEGLAFQQPFGQEGLALSDRLFGAWQRFGEHHDRGRLATELAPIQTELRALLEQAGPKRPKNKHHRRFANNLLKIWPALWTFVTAEGVEPTNNAAERSLRGPVIQRRLSYGTRTQNGERFIERALSASVTCRLQRRSLYTYLCDLLTAHARGDPLPTLT
jgi:transposase